MRYLKTYKIFESNVHYYKPILDTVKDILQDCEDLGFNVYLFESNGVYDDPSIFTKANMMLASREDLNATDEVEVIRLFIEHNPSEYSETSFKYKDIKSDINHLIEYMNQLGYNNYLYQDIYTEFNYVTSHNKASIPNIVPGDDEMASVVKLVFYKEV